MKEIFYYLLIVVFVLSSLNAFGQENLLYDRIQQAKTERVGFQAISDAFRQASDEREMLSHFENPGEVQFVLYEKTVFGKLSEALSITLPINNEHVQLELLEVPDSFYGYEVVTSDGQRLPASQGMRHYRGIVKDDPGSVVSMSFKEDEVMGIVATDKGNFNLSLDRKSGKHIFFNDKNLKDKMGFHCGVTDDHAFHGYDPEVLAQASKHSISSEDACTRIYFETEYDFFEELGSTTAVESYVAGIFNHVSTLYQNENVEIGLSEIFIWISEDPYTEVDLRDLLIQFESNRTSFNGDLAQLLTFRGTGTLPSGIAGSFSGLCNTDFSERLSVSMFNNHITYAQVPTFSWPVFIVAHELGHLFGSRHTHACVWNGDNTAIDGCGDCQEHPTPGQPGCAHCTRPSDPVGGGTIMSYCAMPGKPGVNFNLGFGLQPGNVIRDNVDGASCLCSCFSGSISGGDLLCSSSVYDLSSSVPSGASVAWTATPSGAVNITGSGNSRTVAPIGGFKGFVTLRVTVTTSCGDTQAIKRVYVGTPDDALIVTASHWGPPIVREIDASTTTFAEATYNQVPVPGGHTHFIEEYEWDIWDTHSNWSIIPQHGGGPPFNADVEIDLWHNPLPVQQTIYVRVRNPCGWSLWQETFWDVVGGCSFCAFTVYPNPAAETLHIRLDHGEGKPSESKSNLASYTIGIYSEDGNLVWEKETDSTEEQIPTAAWKEGIYHVRIHHPEGNYSQKVIIRH